jgi:CRP-like cAMP-binding protein
VAVTLAERLEKLLEARDAAELGTKPASMEDLPMLTAQIAALVTELDAEILRDRGTDPLTRLRALGVSRRAHRALVEEVERQVRLASPQAREEGVTAEDIADALGISREDVHDLVHNRAEEPDVEEPDARRH